MVPQIILKFLLYTKATSQAEPLGAVWSSLPPRSGVSASLQGPPPKVPKVDCHIQPYRGEGIPELCPAGEEVQAWGSPSRTTEEPQVLTIRSPSQRFNFIIISGH